MVQKLIKHAKKFLFKKKPAVCAGVWADKQQFLSAVERLKQQGFKGFSAVTPFAVHGLEELMGIKRSWIPWVTFIFGLGGCLFGLWFTWWTSAVSWPLIIGGKPFWSLPAFVPVIFECTILLGALATAGALFYACGLPDFDLSVLDKDLTSHKFAVVFYLDKEKKSSAELENILRDMKAERILHSEF